MTAPRVAPPASSAQAAQAGLVIVLSSQVEQALGTLDLQKLNDAMPGFKTLIAGLVRKYGAGAGTLAARFYKSQRANAGVTAPFQVQPAPLPPLQQIGQTVDWATNPLWSAAPDLEATLSNLQGSVESLVLNVGRDTVIANAQRDTKARGWARVTEPGACYFCALLATRGAVYNEDTAGFQAHDHCRCHAEPVFTAYEPSAEVRQWMADYAKATRSVSGSKAKQLAWRRAFEGRTAP